MPIPPPETPPTGTPPAERRELRRTLALTAAGALANAVWLWISVRDGELQSALLSGFGLVLCTLPALLCARRLARLRRGAMRA